MRMNDKWKRALPPRVTERECAEYARELARIRDEELAKPEHGRDAALIEECGESLRYFEKRRKELRRAHGRLGGRGVRTALIAAVIALLLAANAVSFASGRAALFDSVRWNVRRYMPGGGEDGICYPEERIPRSGEKHSFSSEKELDEFFGGRLRLPGSFRAVYFVSAEAEGERDNALVTCEYRVNKSRLILVIDVYAEQREGALTVAPELYSEDEYSRAYHYGGMMVGESGKYCFVSFDRGSDCYLLIGGQGREILEDIALKMILSRR